MEKLPLRSTRPAGAGNIWLLAAALALASCATTQIIRTTPVPIQQASGEISGDALLDVTIVEFETGLPEDPAEAAELAEEEGINPDVRKAEGRFISFHLKDTLEGSGNWGAVRVMPQAAKITDLELRGRILESDGERLEVVVEARDATNRLWFRRSYEELASRFSYGEESSHDPFQNLYNRLANDLLQAAEKLSGEERQQIRRVSSLRFAADLSPYAFGDYLQTKRGRLKITQLPAEDDAMVQRANRIRDREYLFADTLNDYYAEFYREMSAPYDDWRQFTYEEILLLREAKRQARNRMLAGVALVLAGAIGADRSDTRSELSLSTATVAGGLQVFGSGLQRMKSAEIHRETLHELSESLGEEIKPVVLEVEGRTIELTGSVNAQYEQWRQLLRRIYAEETGLPVN